MSRTSRMSRYTKTRLKIALTNTLATVTFSYAAVFSVIVGCIAGMAYGNGMTCRRACVEAQEVMNHPAMAPAAIAALACLIISLAAMAIAHNMDSGRRIARHRW